MTTWTLFENFEGFSQILKEQSGKKDIWMGLQIQQQQFKHFKPLYRKKNLGVRVVVDYADTGFFSFVIENLREN